MLATEFEQRVATLLPPIVRVRQRLFFLAVELFPSRAEHSVRSHLADRDFMQTRHETVALLLVDHERDVEIVRSLRDEINLLLFEQFERVAESMQDRSD